MNFGELDAYSSGAQGKLGCRGGGGGSYTGLFSLVGLVVTPQ